MKKILALLISFILIFAISVPTFAAGTATAVINASNEIKREDTIEITISLKDCENYSSIYLVPTYDSDIFKYDSSEWMLKDFAMKDAKQASAIIAFDKDQTQNGDAYKIVLNVDKEAKVGNTTISIAYQIKNDAGELLVNKSASKTIEICCKDHTYEGANDGWVVKTEPTCTTEGSKDRVCTTCKKVETEKVAALDHAYGDWTKSKDATCTDKGEEKRICKNDASHIETRPVDALGHSFGGWKVAKAATCTAKGTQERTCSVCKTVETRATKALGHVFESPVVVKEATLSSTGLMEGKCKNCGETTSQVVPCTAKDEKTGITVEAEEGVFTEGTTTDFSKIEKENEKYADVQNALADKSGKFDAYNIAFKNNGAAVAPNGKFTLVMPADSSIDEDNLAVYYIDANNTASEKEFTVNSDGTVSVEATETGIFVIADKSVAGSKAETNAVVDEPTTGDDADTADKDEKDGGSIWWLLILIAVLLIAAIVVVIIILKKKKENDGDNSHFEIK